MNNFEQAQNKKREYQKPKVEIHDIDNEISLVMESLPPEPDGSLDPDFSKFNPFKMLKF